MALSLHDIQSAADIVYSRMPATPQYTWPMLNERLGTEVWVKHENHTPVGAFKIRGGLYYFSRLADSEKLANGVISATRGNHGQSIGYAARRYEIPVTIVVPHGNSVEKNAAMRAQGVELIEYGEDFQEAREYAEKRAGEQSLHLVPSFHPLLINGVATYSYELLRTVRDLDTIYVPIGLGSGICGMVYVRDLLGSRARITGVVSSHARAYAESLRAGRVVESPAQTRLADGMACRLPDPDALEIIRRGADRIVEVSDREVAEAMRTVFECTHNVCEGAGAAAVAAAVKEKNRNHKRKIAVILSGGNVDRHIFSAVLGDAGMELTAPEQNP